jgi:hypothetical protein
MSRSAAAASVSASPEARISRSWSLYCSTNASAKPPAHRTIVCEGVYFWHVVRAPLLVAHCLTDVLLPHTGHSRSQANPWHFMLHASDCSTPGGSPLMALLMLLGSTVDRAPRVAPAMPKTGVMRDGRVLYRGASSWRRCRSSASPSCMST